MKYLPLVLKVFGSLGAAAAVLSPVLDHLPADATAGAVFAKALPYLSAAVAAFAAGLGTKTPGA